MIIIASFLVFMLVHQHAVCDDLSAFKNIAQDHPEGFMDDYIEPLKENFMFDEGFPGSSVSDPQDQEDIEWMKTNIVDKYNFVKDPTRGIWTKLPVFKEELGTPEFSAAADRVKKFFDRNKDWDTTKHNPAFRTKDDCTKLLYITAGRYLFVTHVLYVQSGEKLIPCVRNGNNQIEIPESGVCYPEPYGSASCTSDYDVGLVGKDSGFLTQKFNDYFQDAFGRPSALIFDTNLYAFTLEYSMPALFAKLPPKFGKRIAKKEQTPNYQMQELASAYYKIFKYNEDLFNTMVDGAKGAMTASLSMRKLSKWLKTFSQLNDEVPMKIGGSLDSPEALRAAHNKEYQKFVKKISLGGGYRPRFLDDLAKALIYAAEAYHTRGAIRHVVGGTQMKVVDTLSTLDLWVSMIENWGGVSKEFSHCGSDPLEECFLRSSKYMWRTFTALRQIRERLPSDARDGLLNFDGEGFSNPEYAAKIWMGYRKQGMIAIVKDEANLEAFLKQFQCDEDGFGKPLSPSCMSKMNDKVNAYNVKLASLVTDK